MFRGLGFSKKIGIGRVGLFSPLLFLRLFKSSLAIINSRVLKTDSKHDPAARESNKITERAIEHSKRYFESVLSVYSIRGAGCYS